MTRCCVSTKTFLRPNDELQQLVVAPCLQVHETRARLGWPQIHILRILGIAAILAGKMTDLEHLMQSFAVWGGGLVPLLNVLDEVETWLAKN